MPEYLSNEKKNTFTWLSPLYNPYKIVWIKITTFFKLGITIILRPFLS